MKTPLVLSSFLALVPKLNLGTHLRAQLHCAAVRSAVGACGKLCPGNRVAGTMAFPNGVWERGNPRHHQTMNSSLRCRLLFFTMAILGICSSFGEASSQKAGDPLRLLDEAKLEAQPKQSQNRIYRLIIAPTWGNRFCFRIQNTSGGGLLIMKRLAGQAGYGDGPLAETKEFPLSVSEFQEVEDLIANSGYEKMGLRDPGQGTDGDSWSLEVSKPESYHIAIRWCPNLYDPKKRGTEGFVKAFRWAADKAGVTQRITNKGGVIFNR